MKLYILFFNLILKNNVLWFEWSLIEYKFNYIYIIIIMYKIVKVQKLILSNIMRLTKSQIISALYKLIIINIITIILYYLFLQYFRYYTW